MRNTLSAIVVAAGLLGLGAVAEAAPVSSTSPLGASSSDVQTVQMMSGMERRMMRRRMERRMMERRMMRRRMMRRGM